VAIRTFFQKHLDLELDQDNDAFADAAYQQFPARRERLREVEALYERLPGRPPLPAALQKLGKALEDCRRSRQVEETVIAVKKHLAALADGLEQLAIVRTELTEEAIRSVRESASVRDVQLAQLQQAGLAAGLEGETERLSAQLSAERPWRAISALAPDVARIRERYIEARRSLVNRQNKEAEGARSRVKAREGFQKLSADQAHSVLRPIAEALFDTTAEATAPSLDDMGTRFPQRLAAAEEAADERLDALLSEMEGGQVVKVEAGLRGREIKNRQELRQVLDELEERVGARLDQGARVRLT